MCGAGPTGVECIAGKNRVEVIFKWGHLVCLTLKFSESIRVARLNIRGSFTVLPSPRWKIRFPEAHRGCRQGITCAWKRFLSRIYCAKTVYSLQLLTSSDKDTSSKCYDHIKNIGIDVHLNTLVSEMDSNYVKCKTKDPETSQISSIEYVWVPPWYCRYLLALLWRIPYGLCIWR